MNKQAEFFKIGPKVGRLGDMIKHENKDDMMPWAKHSSTVAGGSRRLRFLRSLLCLGDSRIQKAESRGYHEWLLRDAIEMVSWQPNEPESPSKYLYCRNCEMRLRDHSLRLWDHSGRMQGWESVC